MPPLNIQDYTIDELNKQVTALIEVCRLSIDAGQLNTNTIRLQGARIEALEERVKLLEDFIFHEETDSNFTFN